MNIREISKPITAKSLNESLAKRFGKRIALEKFTAEQLEDARNKLRTDLFNVETKESFNAVETDAYQKSKLFLDVLNAEITEREANEAAKKPDADGDGVPDWADKKPGKDDNAGKKKGSKPKKGKVPPQFQKESVKEAEEAKMPSKAEVMKCCKEGMSKADCCKKFPDCDQTKLKEMYESCMSEMKAK